MTEHKDVDYAIEVNEHATAIYEVLQEGGSPDRAMNILMMTASMIISNTQDGDGKELDAEKTILNFADKIRSVVNAAKEAGIDPTELAYHTDLARQNVGKKIELERAPLVAVDICNRMSDFDDPLNALGVLAAAAAHVLTNRFFKEEESVKAYKGFTNAVETTVSIAEKMGIAAWVKGTPH